MSFKIEEDAGNKIVYMMLDELSHRNVRAIRKGWFTVGGILLKSVNKAILHKPKSGRTYLVRRGKSTRRHVASAAGETAANLSGVYRKSFGYKVQGWEEMEFGSESGKGADKYADLLERGTSKMKARPAVRNAYNENKGTVVSVFEQTIRDALK